MAAKLLTNFKHLKGVSTFLLSLDKKKERKIAITSVVVLDDLSSNLRMLRDNVALNKLAYLIIQVSLVIIYQMHRSMY